MSSSVGCRLAGEQRRRRDHEARSAEAALHGTRGDECPLHRVQLPVGRQALDRDDVTPVGLCAVHEAAAHEPAVEQHRAGPALALLARSLGSDQVEPLAQHEEQALGAVDVGLARLAVDAQLDPHTRHLVSARRVSTPRAWRR